MDNFEKSRNFFKIADSRKLLRQVSQSNLTRSNILTLYDTNKTFHFPSIDKYIKRPNPMRTFYKPHSNNIEFKEVKETTKDLKVYSSKIIDVKVLNDEFKKSFIIRKKMSKSHSTNLFQTPVILPKETYKLNQTLHSKFIGEKFDKTLIEKDLNIYRKYSLYIMDLVNRRLKEAQMEFTPFNKQTNITQGNKALLQNKYILDQLEMTKYQKYIETSAKEIVSKLENREKEIKKISYKEIGLNKSFDSIIDSVFRKVKYLKQNNLDITADKVINLIHQEVIDITKNIENVTKSPAFIKNFYSLKAKDKFPYKSMSNNNINIQNQIISNNTVRNKNLYPIKEGDNESHEQSKIHDRLQRKQRKNWRRNTHSIKIDDNSLSKFKFKHGGNDKDPSIEEPKSNISLNKINSGKDKYFIKNLLNHIDKIGNDQNKVNKSYLRNPKEVNVHKNPLERNLKKKKNDEKIQKENNLFIVGEKRKDIVNKSLEKNKNERISGYNKIKKNVNLKNKKTSKHIIKKLKIINDDQNKNKTEEDKKDNPDQIIENIIINNDVIDQIVFNNIEDVKIEEILDDSSKKKKVNDIKGKHNNNIGLDISNDSDYNRQFSDRVYIENETRNEEKRESDNNKKKSNQYYKKNTMINIKHEENLHNKEEASKVSSESSGTSSFNLDTLGSNKNNNKKNKKKYYFNNQYQQKGLIINQLNNNNL